MLYTSEQINTFNIYQHQEAVGRYLHKFVHPNEFRRLKLHEKDYLFRWMKAIKDDDGVLVYNLYKIPEASEFVFFDIILTYGEDVKTFSRAFYGPFGKLDANKVRKDQRFFNEYLQVWKNQINKHKGPFLEIIKPLLNDKLKELKLICKTKKEYKNREKYCYASFFWIYYRARLYFEEKGQTFHTFSLFGYTFISNIYTYCHILSRHYIPSLNIGLENTMNSDIPCIDLDHFLESIQNLVISYFNASPCLDTTKEYLLFNIDGEKYILWIKYKRCNELSHKEGFEIKTFYKCEKENDINKYIGTKEIEFNNGCYCCIPNE